MLGDEPTTGRRQWGKRIEDNQQLLVQQNEMIDGIIRIVYDHILEQDQRLDILGDGLKKAKNVAIAIGSELDDQSTILDDVIFFDFMMF